MHNLLDFGFTFSCRLRDPLLNQSQPLLKLIRSSGEWKLHMRHCRLNLDLNSFIRDSAACEFVLWFLLVTKVASVDEQDAAGLTQLSSTVEDVFASGDLPRAAETLANMRHCLTAVGEVFLQHLNYISCYT